MRVKRRICDLSEEEKEKKRQCARKLLMAITNNCLSLKGFVFSDKHERVSLGAK